MTYRPAKARLNLNALRHNLSVAKALTPNSKLLAVIKANGYGHGIVRVAEQLHVADGFGVASIDDALILRQQGFLQRILLLEGLFSKTELSLALQNRLDLVIHSHHQLEWLLSDSTEVNTQPDSGLETDSLELTLWIKIDTGMHRLGFKPEEVDSVVERIETNGNRFKIHLMSHLATADEDDLASQEFTQHQITVFDQACSAYEFPKSLLNSAGIQEYSNKGFDWVRPGILLYGAGQTISVSRTNGQDSDETHPCALQPVMQLESEVIAIKQISTGESVGYGRTWIAERDSVIAVVAIGYGDGYPRHAPSGTPVLINGVRVPLVGRVSMDMISVDITDHQKLVKVGSPAVLWGVGLGVDEVAHWSGTIGYELLCGVAPRVPRIEE